MTEFDDVRQAYLEMAFQAKHRPAAPCDCTGTITLSWEEQGDPYLLEKEASQYAKDFINEMNKGHAWVTDGRTRRVSIYALEAYKMSCSFEPVVVQKLLAMALKENAPIARREADANDPFLNMSDEALASLCAHSEAENLRCEEMAATKTSESGDFAEF